MSPDQQLMHARQDAAVALQKLCFRATQQKGFVRIEDCQAVTDMITVAVMAALSNYLTSEETQDDQHVAH